MSNKHVRIMFRNGESFSGVVGDEESDGILFAYKEFKAQSKGFTNLLEFSCCDSYSLFDMNEIIGIISSEV